MNVELSYKWLFGRCRDNYIWCTQAGIENSVVWFLDNESTEQSTFISHISQSVKNDFFFIGRKCFCELFSTKLSSSDQISIICFSLFPSLCS